MNRLRLLIVIVSLTAADAFADTCSGWAGLGVPVRYAASADRIVLVRDLDGDGLPEIIVSGNHADEIGTLSIFSNRGHGTFAAERLLSRGFGEELRDIADLNHDGLSDLLTSDYWSNGIVVSLGRGALDFDAGTRYDTATHGGPSLIIDYDHDGTPDLISFSFGSGNPVRAHFFRGLGNGTLGTKTTFDTQLANADWPSSRTINGALEILVNERSGHLGIVRYANGVATATTVQAGPGVADLSSTFADVNGDGIADIVDTDLIDSTQEPVFITLANADGTFRARTQLAHPRTVSFPVQVRVRDLDGDGRPDLIVSDFQSQTLHVYRGTGTGDFAEGIAIDAGSPVNSFDIADVNGDGYLDIVTANNDHTVSVLMNRGPCPPSRRRAARH
jgi:hypothetical protein